MIVITLIVIFLTIISIILLYISKLVSFFSHLDAQKISPFECGFDSKTKARLPLSLQFFLTAIIFLVFDVEITLLLPIPLSLEHNFSILLFSITLSFIFILLLGLYYEWKKGALNWII